MTDVKLVHKKNPIIPFNFGGEIYSKLLKHRHITGIPTTAHLRRLILKDIEENKDLYGKGS